MANESFQKPGTATLVVPLPGSVRPPTDTPAAILDWLPRHGAPRTADLLKTLERNGWTIEVPNLEADTQQELWATARHRSLGDARTAARPYLGRVQEQMRWSVDSTEVIWVAVRDAPRR